MRMRSSVRWRRKKDRMAESTSWREKLETERRERARRGLQNELWEPAGPGPLSEPGHGSSR